MVAVAAVAACCLHSFPCHAGSKHAGTRVAHTLLTIVSASLAARDHASKLRNTIIGLPVSFTARKNGFVTATNEFFVASTKNFAAATKRFVDGTKHFVVVTKYFCYPYFNK